MRTTRRAGEAYDAPRMIARIEGVLEDVTDGVAEVRIAGGIVHELLVPACDAGELLMRKGREVSFFTLHYLESQGQGSHFVPRLIGFSSREQRAFFELLTTVKGIGNRKALRAMQVSHGRIAESTIVELKGKLDPFLADPAAARRAEQAASVAAIAALPVGPAADAEEVLVALGEPRPHARAKIERVLAGAGGAALPADEIVTRALRARGVG